MWLINVFVMNFNFNFLRNDTNGVFDKVLYHKVSCLFISSEPCLFIIKLWNCSTATQFSRSDEMNDVLTWSWFQRKEWSSQLNSIQRNCTKKKQKKKRPEKIWPSSGVWCFKVSKWANDNWDWHMTEPHQSLNLSEFSLETCLIPV